MSPPTLVVLGSGPGIGISTAKAFARKNHFSTIALVSRNAECLSKEKAEVEQEGHAQVVTYPTDLADLGQLHDTLKEIEKLGPVGCIFFNAATVRMSEVLTTSVEEIEEDFKVASIPFELKVLPWLTKSTVGHQPRVVRYSTMGHSPPPEERPPFAESHCHEQPFARTADSDVALSLGSESEPAEYLPLAKSCVWEENPYRRDQGVWLGEAGCEESQSEEHC